MFYPPQGRERPAPSDGEIICIVGAPGSGKTWATTDALTYEIARGKRVIALDLTGDIATYLERAGVEGIVRESSYADMLRFRHRNARVLCYVTGKRALKDTVADWLKHCVENHQRGDVFVCDEAELVFLNGKRTDYGLRVMKLTRNWGIRLYTCSQRPQLIDNLLRSNASHVAVFRSDSRLFVEGCQEFGDVERFQRAESLPQHHYLYRGRFTEAGALQVLNAREDRAPWLTLAKKSTA